ncbi:MAG: hypothetical protein K9K88_10890 [Desulfobacterales bacterium]|nr:hypothetical protein [Desulfobacterales bacterium]
MYIPARPRRAALLCCHFTRNLAYYRAGRDGGKPIFPKNELWVTLNSNFLDISVLEWCKLFAESKAFHSFRKVTVSPDAFLPQLYSDFGATRQEWDSYLQKMREYRDKFIAHLDRKKTMDIPTMDLAEFAIFYLYDTMRGEQIEGVFRGLPRNLREYSRGCYLEAAKLYESAA